MSEELVIPAGKVIRVTSDSLEPIISNALTVLDVIAAAARDPEVRVDKLEKLFELKERVDRAEAERAFNQAMTAAQEEMPRVIKDADNPHTHSKYARLESIDKAIRPIYTKHGFSLSFNSGPASIPGALRVLCDLRHTAGFTRSYELEGALDDTGSQGKSNKTGIQALGSSSHYLRRYLTTMIFNIAIAGEDSDGNSWQAGKERAAKMAAENIEKLKAGKPSGPEPPLEETLAASIDKAETDNAARSPFFKLLDSFKELHNQFSAIGADEVYYGILGRFGLTKSNQFKNTAEGFNAARKCFKAMGAELRALEHAQPYDDWPEEGLNGQPVRIAGVLYVMSEESGNYRALNSIASAS